ncbi:MAG: metal ABC transporter permease [Aestuariivita sp.]|nr:metal ABC transporter permease [Aestuariivita sp.]
MLDDFVVRAVLAGVGVTFAAAPLGCFVVWHRMVYFGDATAHAAILGIAFALALSLPIFLGTLFVALLMALIVTAMGQKTYAPDTIMGVVAHSGLAFGLVAISLIDSVRVDLSSFLFGDILAVSRIDLAIIWVGAVAVVVLIAWRWSALLTTTLNTDMARSAGLHARTERLLLTLALAMTVAVAIKVVGALLIGALLVIPAASARCFARTPEIMAFLAILLGWTGSLGGLGFSFVYDTPSGPTIVCALALLFALSNMLRMVRNFV